MNHSIQSVNVSEQTSELQQAIELVETLPLEFEEVLVEIIQKRLHQRRRAELLQTVLESERDYVEGDVHCGTPFLKNFLRVRYQASVR
jgi:hypothetical protein